MEVIIILTFMISGDNNQSLIICRHLVSNFYRGLHESFATWCSLWWTAELQIRTLLQRRKKFQFLMHIFNPAVHTIITISTVTRWRTKIVSPQTLSVKTWWRPCLFWEELQALADQKTLCYWNLGNIQWKECSVPADNNLGDLARTIFCDF